MPHVRYASACRSVRYDYAYLFLTETKQLPQNERSTFLTWATLPTRNSPEDGVLTITLRREQYSPPSDLRDQFPKLLSGNTRSNFSGIKTNCEEFSAFLLQLGLADLTKWLGKVEALNREWFMKTEEILHSAQYGPMWLEDNAVAEKVAHNLHRLDGELFGLDA